jgi:hypothetical protein
LHIVRHPRAVVASMQHAGRTWARVAYWRDSSTKVLARWVTNEERVLAIRDSGIIPVLTVRFEDLCTSPSSTMRAVFEFLQLDLPATIAEAIDKTTRRVTNEKYAGFELPLESGALALMRRYQYE